MKGKTSKQLMESYIQSASDIIQSCNTITSIILDTYKSYPLTLTNNTFHGTTTLQSENTIGEVTMLVYFTIRIPTNTRLTKNQKRPIHEYNNMLKGKNNILFLLSELLQTQAEVIYYTDKMTIKEYSDASGLITLRKKAINKLIIDIKKHMYKLNELYKDVKEKTYL